MDTDAAQTRILVMVLVLVTTAATNNAQWFGIILRVRPSPAQPSPAQPSPAQHQQAASPRLWRFDQSTQYVFYRFIMAKVRVAAAGNWVAECDITLFTWRRIRGLIVPTNILNCAARTHTEEGDNSHQIQYNTGVHWCCVVDCQHRMYQVTTVLVYDCMM